MITRTTGIITWGIYALIANQRFLPVTNSKLTILGSWVLIPSTCYSLLSRQNTTPPKFGLSALEAFTLYPKARRVYASSVNLASVNEKQCQHWVVAWNELPRPITLWTWIWMRDLLDATPSPGLCRDRGVNRMAKYPGENRETFLKLNRYFKLIIVGT